MTLLTLKACHKAAHFIRVPASLRGSVVERWRTKERWVPRRAYRRPTRPWTLVQSAQTRLSPDRIEERAATYP
ncbi:hypothetical protein BD311DRAFT_757949 [Dichomitus squalens]|uniref:Uncharacterized protein n=1 Tax=Dichomitus squalens TaxID=114155 RepID=A0A4Q9MR88_9APHY|nr:hypothetical protein BD311DRAFT_757949 [Dichomitus squalens]